MNASKILIFVLALVLACAGCTVGAQTSYQPPFAPIKFSIDTSGQVAFSTESQIVTTFGTFAIEGKGAASLVPESDETLLTVRHKTGDTVVDSVYKLATTRAISIRIVGTVDMTVQDRVVFIDTTGGPLQEFEVQDSGGGDGLGGDLPVLTPTDITTATESDLRSTDGGSPTWTEFANNHTTSVEVIRVGSDRTFYLHKILAPGESYIQQAFVGSSWLARETDGERLIRNFWRPVAAPSRADIR